MHDNDTLKALIKVASITSSMVNSKSRTSSDTNNAVEIINQTMQMLPCKGVTLNKSPSSESNKTDNNSSDYTIIDLDESNW